MRFFFITLIIWILIVSQYSCNKKNASTIQREEERMSVPASTSLVVNQSRTCQKDPYNEGDWCIFKVGKGLEFEINAVGTKDATTSITRAEPNEKTDYRMKFWVGDFCIRIKTGNEINRRLPHIEGLSFLYGKATAFLSPFDGIAYPTERECTMSVAKDLLRFQNVEKSR